MPQVSSPVLLDHAIAAVFADFGGYPVSFIRKVLTILRADYGDGVPAKPVIDRFFAGARLKGEYADTSFTQLWAALDAKREEECERLRTQFAALIASGHRKGACCTC